MSHHWTDNCSLVWLGRQLLVCCLLALSLLPLLTCTTTTWLLRCYIGTFIYSHCHCHGLLITLYQWLKTQAFIGLCGLRVCGLAEETIIQLLSACPALASTSYTRYKKKNRKHKKVPKQGEDSRTLEFCIMWDPYFDCCQSYAYSNKPLE